MEYIIARLESGRFSVAKFDGDEEPANVYEVSLDGKGTCDCPAYTRGGTRPCKHIGMVQGWLKNNE